ncbi:hypothetical protein Tco_0695330 [Tanacetum coccineum]
MTSCLLLRRGCFTFGNGEYVKSGLSRWIIEVLYGFMQHQSKKGKGGRKHHQELIPESIGRIKMKGALVASRNTTWPIDEEEKKNNLLEKEYAVLNILIAHDGLNLLAKCCLTFSLSMLVADTMEWEEAVVEGQSEGEDWRFCFLTKIKGFEVVEG